MIRVPRGQWISTLLYSIILLSLAGCAFAPGGHIDYDTDSAPLDDVVDIEPITFGLIQAQREAIVPLTTEKLNTLAERASSQGQTTYDYRIGIGDVLTIIVYEHPELTIPAGAERSASDAGNVVHSDGTIFYPYIGRVEAAGRTVREVRSEIQRRLATYIASPQVDVKIASYKSQMVYVTGQVQTPGQYSITNVPMRILDAVSMAGGLNNSANWHEVVLTREGEEFELSVFDMLQNGALDQNLLMQDGDVLHVPDTGNQKVFVMGEVMRPASLPMANSRISLTDAIAQAGGIDERQASAAGIFVVRQAEEESSKLATVYQLDARNSTAFVLGAQFMLEPTDVVYVTASPLGRWNRVISQLLPTVTSIYQTANTADEINSFGN